MAKDAYYFSHDYNARNDPKLVKLQQKLKHEGKGVYWDLIELMYEQGGKLEIAEIESYAYTLRAKFSTLESVIRDFNLFVLDDKFIRSASVERRLAARHEKSEKYAKNAQKRWEKSDSNANGMQLHSNGKAGKEIKGKDSKGKDKKGEEKIDNNDDAEIDVFIVAVIDYLNEKTRKDFKASTAGNRKPIILRYNEGYTLEQFKRVIQAKTNEWLNNPGMKQYLRPETLFSGKFDSYLQEWVPEDELGVVEIPEHERGLQL